MAVGDEIGVTEDLYKNLIGGYVSAIEVLSKRIFAKDQHIATLEATLKSLTEAPPSATAQEQNEVSPVA